MYSSIVREKIARARLLREAKAEAAQKGKGKGETKEPVLLKSGAKATYPTHTAGPGNPITFTANLTHDLKSYSITVSPQQDLHGYSAPWPAGGGKNKFNIFAVESCTDTGGAGSSLVQNNNGTITVNTTTQSNVKSLQTLADLAPNLVVGESYILTATSTGSTKYIYLHSSASVWYFGDPRTITQTDLDSFVSFYASGENSSATISGMMIRLASVSDATYAPYSNICPITGWTAVNAWDDPKYGGTIEWNQRVDSSNAASEYSKYGVTFTRVTGKMAFTTSGTYNCDSLDRNAYIFNAYNKDTLVEGHKYCVTNTSKLYCAYVYGANIGGNVASVTGNRTGVSDQVGVIITCTASGGYRVSLHGGTNIPNGTVMDETIYINVFDLTEMFGAGNEPATVEEFRNLFPQDYYDYNAGTTTCVSAVNGDPYVHVSISFPDAAGTVYSATLHVAEDGSGTLTVENVYALLNDPDGWSTTSSNTVRFIYSQNFSDRKIFSSSYEQLLCTYMAVNGNTPRETARWVGSTSTQFGIASDSVTIDQVKSDAQAGKIAICYPLATPQTYSLTAPQISALLGQNVLWTDGNTIQAEYYYKDTTKPSPKEKALMWWREHLMYGTNVPRPDFWKE